MNITEYLQMKGIRQIALAKATGMNSSVLNKYLHGWVEIPRWRQKRLAKEIGITLKEVEAGKVEERRLRGVA